jgi:hypothetical protein
MHHLALLDKELGDMDMLVCPDSNTLEAISRVLYPFPRSQTTPNSCVFNNFPKLRLAILSWWRISLVYGRLLNQSVKCKAV